MYEWLRKEKGGEAEERRQEKGKDKKKRKEDNWIEELLWVPTSFFLIYINNWPLETQVYRYSFKDNYGREKELQKFIKQAYETQK